MNGSLITWTSFCPENVWRERRDTWRAASRYSTSRIRVHVYTHPYRQDRTTFMHGASCVLRPQCTCATPAYSYAPAHRLYVAFIHAPSRNPRPFPSLSLSLFLRPSLSLFSGTTLVFRVPVTIPDDARISGANDFLLRVANDSRGKLGGLRSMLTNFRFVSEEFAWESLVVPC